MTLESMLDGLAIGEQDSPLIKEIIGKQSEVAPGEKKIFQVRDRKILVINDNGNYFAISGLCSHYSYPLDQGVYFNGRIRCPLHEACFNVKTGDIEDHPGFGSLNTYLIDKVNGDLLITVSEKDLSSDHRERKPKITRCSDLPIVVVGGGMAADSFIEHARLNGCPTPITLISKESIPPYDRVPLSKNPASSIEHLHLRPDGYYTERNVDVNLNTSVESVDTRRRVVSLSSGEQVKYSKLVIATGGTVRKLRCPGSDLQNVHYLRTLEQANQIAEQVQGNRVVCIGASVIGMEMASSVLAQAASVTVICKTEEPLPALGTDVGKAIRKTEAEKGSTVEVVGRVSQPKDTAKALYHGGFVQIFESQGVRIIRNATVVQLEGSSKVEGVRLSDGTIVDADTVIAGIGVTPNTDFLKGTCVNLDKNGFIIVDKLFRTSADFVYAIGDVVTAPLPLWGVELANIQHFQTAQAHGQLLGYAIVGRPLPRPIVPFFWTLMFMKYGIRLSGYPNDHTDTIIHGDLDNIRFVKYYLKNDEVVAVATGGLHSVTSVFIELFVRGIKITRKQVEENVDDIWEPLLSEQ